MSVGCTNNTFGVKGVEVRLFFGSCPCSFFFFVLFSSASLPTLFSLFPSPFFPPPRPPKKKKPKKPHQEHAFFFKSIEDAARLRRHVSECFECAALPQTLPEERKRLLSFVVCGGGPTGVEVAAELHDMINDDLVKVYPGTLDKRSQREREKRGGEEKKEKRRKKTPHFFEEKKLKNLLKTEIIKDCRVCIIELQDHLLSTYDRAISEYTDKQFVRSGIELILNSRVLEVCGQGTGKGFVRVKGPDGKEREIDFGACVWSTGVAMHPLVKQLQPKLASGAQTHFRSVVTTPWLEVNVCFTFFSSFLFFSLL